MELRGGPAITTVLALAGMTLVVIAILEPNDGQRAIVVVTAAVMFAFAITAAIVGRRRR